MSIKRSKFSLTRSLRFRLMTWNALVVIVSAYVTLIGLREGVRITLIRELDQLLKEDVEEIELALARYKTADAKALHEQLDRKDAGHAAHKWFVQLVDDEGNVLYASSHAPHDVPFERLRTGTAHSYEMWRFVDRSLNSSKNVTIYVGSSLEIINADIARLDRLVAAAAGIVLLVAPLCGYWLAGRATRPLNKMIGTMGKLRPSKLNERLEIRGAGDELDRLSLTFNRLLDRIGVYLQERRDFLANAAHQLRTPLAAIRSGIEVALSNDRSLEEYEELLSAIIEESASLEVFINQLLLLSETEAEGLKDHRERVRLDELIDKAIDMFGGVAEYRDIQLTYQVSTGVEVNGNRQHLRQVIYNLLDNALKFTPAGGSVHVQLEKDQDVAIFSVDDTGPGISSTDLPLVFDRFFKSDLRRQSNADLRGAGLGLSICKSIVRAHKGTIGVESTQGEGARFTVRLPLADGQRIHPIDDREHAQCQTI